MVVGIAGGVGPTVKIGDLIYADVVIDKSTGTEYRPTHLGAPTARGTIVTSDDFLVEPGMVEELTAAGVIALDMETSAVAAVCESRGCAWSVIRAISDMATDHPDDSVLGLAKPDGSANGPAVAKFLLTKPWRIPHLARLQRDSKLAATAAPRAAAAAPAGPPELDPGPTPPGAAVQRHRVRPVARERLARPGRPPSVELEPGVRAVGVVLVELVAATELEADDQRAARRDVARAARDQRGLGPRRREQRDVPGHDHDVEHLARDRGWSGRRGSR